MHKLLLVGIDKKTQVLIEQTLEDNTCEIKATSSFKRACELAQKTHFSTLLIGITQPKPTLEEVLTPFKSSQVILVCQDQANISQAVESIKLGAFNYVDCNDSQQLIQALNAAISDSSIERKGIQGMLGECAEMQQIYEYIHKVAPTDCNVLILGETGTGKELVARSIHDNSARGDKRLVCVNCAAIPETLIESELFGYEKGAFTGADSSREGLIEAANNSTLFLDEIGELPMEAQARLLRFIQEGEIRRIGSVTQRKVNVRLIAATHRNLKKLCTENHFREDLFYRINVMQLNLPALRARGDDVLMMAYTFLEQSCEQFKCLNKQFSPQAETIIAQYHWPGNIREMQNIIQRAVILCDQDQTTITEDLLSIEPLSKTSLHIIKPDSNTQTAAREQAEAEVKSKEPVNPNKNLSLEDYFLTFVLKHQDSMSETELARKLGISRKCLWERRQRLGIPRKKANKSN